MEANQKWESNFQNIMQFEFQTSSMLQLFRGFNEQILFSQNLSLLAVRYKPFITSRLSTGGKKKEKLCELFETEKIVRKAES